MRSRRQLFGFSIKKICTKYKQKLYANCKLGNARDFTRRYHCLTYNTFTYYILGQSTESIGSVTMLDRLSNPSSN